MDKRRLSVKAETQLDVSTLLSHDSFSLQASHHVLDVDEAVELRIIVPDCCDQRETVCLITHGVLIHFICA